MQVVEELSSFGNRLGRIERVFKARNLAVPGMNWATP
jgi:hypothetical protein